MKPELCQKYEDLKNILSGMESAAIAFSGGVDSSFLLYASHQVLKKNVVAVTVKSPYIPEWEFAEAKAFTKKFGIRHILVNASIPDSIKMNPPERCYLCKKTIFGKLQEISNSENLKWLADGTNSDDTKDFRPGIKALEELHIRSPLKEAGLTKKDIRELSRGLKLPTWNKPAYACLLTRIPYNILIDEETLGKIEKAEKFIMDLSIRDIRVRHHGDVARIETDPKNFKKIALRHASEINQFLKGLGYKFVTLDLGGYRTGSFNE